MNDAEVFTTAQQYRDWLDRRAAAEHRGLHEHQADITYGSHWVRFIDLDLGVIQFGKVLTLNEASALHPGLGLVRRQAIETGVDRLAIERDMVLSIRHDRLSPEPDLGYAHRSHLWPIEERLYQMAMGVDFDHRNFTEVPRFLLDVAFRGMRAHVVSR